jgi:holo-[acyl-carrier protein] synthase
MVGIDVVEISRVTLRESFIRHVLTQKEQAEYARKQTDQARREYLAGRFAAKEAYFKATQDPAWLHISVLNHENGQPYIDGRPDIQISISHDGPVAASVVFIP